MRNLIFASIGTFVLCSACNSNGIGVEGLNTVEKETVINYGKLPLKNDQGHFTAVIEIPAGTNLKYEYNYTSNTFECEVINGKPRKIQYLPYPANYGFIPGTLMDKAKGGDGDALDVLVLGETLPTGKVIAIHPIATLRLLDRGEEDHKIIAVPVEDNFMGINTYKDLPFSIKEIIQIWFTNYKGPGKMEFISWENDSTTLEEISKWAKSN